MDIVYFLLVGAAAGWLAGLVMGQSASLVRNIIVGILGGFVGGFVFPKLGLSFGSGTIGAVLMATAGAILMLFIVGLVTKKKS